MKLITTLITCPGSSTPTRGEKEIGQPSGGVNWNALGPCEGAVPLATALFRRVSLGLLREIVAVLVLPIGVGAKLIKFPHIFKGESTPHPLHSIL